MPRRVFAWAIGGALVVLIVLPALLTVDPTATFVFAPRLPPSADHLLGTDALGRDVLDRKSVV